MKSKNQKIQAILNLQSFEKHLQGNAEKLESVLRRTSPNVIVGFIRKELKKDVIDEALIQNIIKYGSRVMEGLIYHCWLDVKQNPKVSVSLKQKVLDTCYFQVKDQNVCHLPYREDKKDLVFSFLNEILRKPISEYSEAEGYNNLVFIGKVASQYMIDFWLSSRDSWSKFEKIVVEAEYYAKKRDENTVGEVIEDSTSLYNNYKYFVK